MFPYLLTVKGDHVNQLYTKQIKLKSLGLSAEKPLEGPIYK